jgi:hypothetical protein
MASIEDLELIPINWQDQVWASGLSSTVAIGWCPLRTFCQVGLSVGQLITSEPASPEVSREWGEGKNKIKTEVTVFCKSQ